MKKLICVIIAAVMALTLASCELSEQMNVQKRTRSTVITFAWWGNEQRSRYTLEGLEEFEKQKGITVSPRYSELTGFKDRLDMDKNADTMCDAFQMQYSWLNEYASQGYEFYDMYKLKNVIKLGNFSEEQLKLGEVDGKLIGIPTSLNSINFFYNSSTLRRYGFSPPETWDELFRLGERLKGEGIYAAEMSEKSLWFSCVAYTEQATGKPMMDKNGKMQYTADDFKVMLEFYKKLIDSNVTARPSEFNHTDFYNSKAAGIACWISETESYFASNRGVDANKVDISLGYQPVINADKRSGWYKKPMALYCIKGDTREPEKTAQLVDFLLNSETMAVLQGTEKGIPLSRSALEVLESRDMLSDLQAVATKRMEEDKSIGLMDPALENDEIRALFFAKADEVTYNNADAYQKGTEVCEAAKKIGRQ
ncbi:MAG: carbohydrate ABC transporter substrate-binding protein [Ruminococcus sp.]|nr:carbohydrate ABC transporter substrate-binding protein [Ruminococcus sp.]